MSNDNATLHMCPKCSSAAITTVIVDELTGGTPEFLCEACGWRGTVQDVVAVPFSHDWQNQAGLADALVSDLRLRLAKNLGREFLEYLIRWGFMTAPEPRLLGRYLAAIAQAIVTSIIEVRLALEKEATSARAERN